MDSKPPIDPETKVLLIYILGSVGVILMIIVTVIVVVKCCCKKKKEELDLPPPQFNQ